MTSPQNQLIANLTESHCNFHRLASGESFVAFDADENCITNRRFNYTHDPTLHIIISLSLIQLRLQSSLSFRLDGFSELPGRSPTSPTKLNYFPRL